MADRCMALGDDRGHTTTNGRTTKCGLTVVPVDDGRLRRAHRPHNRCNFCRPPTITDYVINPTRDDPPPPAHTTPPPPPTEEPIRVQPRRRRVTGTLPPEPKVTVGIDYGPDPPAIHIHVHDDPPHPLAGIWQLCDHLTAAANAATRANIEEQRHA